jgi:hypothetical protein
MSLPARPPRLKVSRPPLVRLRYGLVTRRHPYDGVVGRLQNHGFPADPATQATGFRLLPRWDCLPQNAPAFAGRTTTAFEMSVRAIEVRLLAGWSPWCDCRPPMSPLDPEQSVTIDRFVEIYPTDEYWQPCGSSPNSCAAGMLGRATCLSRAFWKYPQLRLKPGGPPRIHAIGHCLEAVIIKPTNRTTMEYAGTLARDLYGSIE